MATPLLIFSTTLSVSLFARFITQYLSEQTQTLRHSDQFSRGFLLGYALFSILPHAANDLGWLWFTFLFTSITVFIFSVEKIFKYLCKQEDMHSKPYLFYACLLPHCLLEGFSISNLGAAGNSLILLGFMAHKISEISMVTLSTKIHLSNPRAQRLVQTLFILATPAMMLLHLLVRHRFNSTFFHDHHAYVDLLNFVALVHLSLFCKLCDCKHMHKKSLFTPRFFMFAGLLLSMLLFAFNSPTCSHHSHDDAKHAHHHSHHHH